MVNSMGNRRRCNSEGRLGVVAVVEGDTVVMIVVLFSLLLFYVSQPLLDVCCRGVLSIAELKW